ncbi:hypothetical protein L7F22_044255 [Adiantum nelumboides]|nr:hypothetical protein [Adiantum nelumboides]
MDDRSEHKIFLQDLKNVDMSLDNDWCYKIASEKGNDELAKTRVMQENLANPLRVLVLYGSNREKSYSRLLSFEVARLLHYLGCDVRVYDPRGLPLRDDPSISTSTHPKVNELLDCIAWSQAQFWCSPEQHGNMTGIMKTMIDHIPLSSQAIRPTQGKVLAIAQLHALNGASQIASNLIRPELPAGEPKVYSSNETRLRPHFCENDQEGAPLLYGGDALDTENLPRIASDTNRAPEINLTKETQLTEQQWDQALTQLGGDTSKCCAGFFDCSVEESIAAEAKQQEIV